MFRKASAAGIVALAGMLAAVGVAAPASASDQVHCGQIVTTDVTLSRDLVCPGDGLVVGANDLHIDLGGHRITGSGVGSGITTVSPAFGPWQRLSVSDGVVTGFAAGVRLNMWSPSSSGPAEASVSNVTLRNNDYGIDARASYGTLSIDRSRLEGNAGFGVEAGSSHLTVAGSRVSGNGVGLRTHLFASTNVQSSDFRRNGTGVWCAENGVSIRDSRFSDNDTGVLSYFCGTFINSSSFTGGAVGISVHEDLYGLDISNNTIRGSGIGVRVDGTTRQASGLGVVGNVVSGNRASGMYLHLVNVTDLQVRDNRAVINGYAPAGFTDPSGRPLTAGIWIDGGTVSGNVAIGNAGYGIEAYPPAVDGGGNVARGNGGGASGQCLFVECTPKAAAV